MYNITTTPLCLDDSTSFAKYNQIIAEKFCPYLIPAAKEGVIFQSSLPDLSLKTVEEAQAAICLACIVLTERLRQYRREHNNKKGLLYCENLVINKVPKHLDLKDGGELVRVPHTILNCLYTDVGIVFGSFWKEIELISKASENVPPPPYPFIAIRSIVKPKDFYFFEKSPSSVLETVKMSNDDGRNVFTPFKSEFPKLPIIDSLTDFHLFNELRSWALKKIKKHTLQ